MKTKKNTKFLKKTLQQKFDQCNEATLVVGQKDLVQGRFLFISLNVKSVAVKCYATGKTIPKRYWNEQTNADAKELSSQYKVSKKGWHINVFAYDYWDDYCVVDSVFSYVAKKTIPKNLQR